MGSLGNLGDLFNFDDPLGAFNLSILLNFDDLLGTFNLGDLLGADSLFSFDWITRIFQAIMGAFGV